jgi:hypothetical protein
MRNSYEEILEMLYDLEREELLKLLEEIQLILDN